MKKIFTLLFVVCICTFAMGQHVPADIAKAGDVKPVIDGVLDEVWTDVEQHNVTLPFGTEAPTLGDEGTTFWKALWDDDGMYIVIVANDDVWYPYSGTGDAYTFDKIELYFDTNFLLEDGVGGQNGATGNRQIAPDPNLDNLDGQEMTQTILGGTVRYAYKVENPKWTTEWFIPWTSIPDGEGNLFDKTAPMGFDVDITDNDNDGAGRKRAMWSNTGTKAENWGNMDDAGRLTLLGAEPGVNIESIAITGGSTIDTDNGTVQLTATILPVDATQGFKYVITEGAKMATVDNTGLLKAVRENGTVKVKAQSSDGFVSSNELTITISNQVVTMEEISVIKNGQFNHTDNVEFWGRNPASAWVVEDGWLTGTAVPKTEGAEIWDIMTYQGVDVDATTKYIIKFKAKASSNMDVPFITEDINHSYNKTVTSSSPFRAETQWNIPVTTEETQFELDVIHSAFVEGSKYQPSFQIGKLTGTVSVTDIFMYAEEDLALVSGVKDPVVAKAFSVYPNPAAKTLFVDLKGINSKVAIYNALGQKLMEQNPNGSRLSFDVSSLAKGLYFVKLEDGSTQKFVK